MEKKCIYCENLFITRSHKKNHCFESECQLTYLRDKYKKTSKKKKCKQCGNEYIGTIKQLYCSDTCSKQANSLVLKQELKCKKCNTTHKIIERKISTYGYNKFKEIKIKGLCLECKKDSWKDFSERQKGENNTNFNPNKKSRRKHTPEEFKIKMSIHNPMKNDETKEKVRKKLKEKYQNNEIIRPIGKLSPLWKGNRKRSFIIRTRLSNWRKKWLDYFKYKCSTCESKKYLEVHHEKPLHEIIKEITPVPLDELSYDEFENLIVKIIDKHEDVKGVVLCKYCHSKVDSKRKI